MDIYGLHVLPEPDDKSESGFTTTVHDDKGVTRGPFATVSEAIKCAHEWNAENLAKLEAAATPVATASETVAVQIQQPVVNPPLAEAAEHL